VSERPETPEAITAVTRRRVLDPTERFAEILFGLIMVLTFTGSLSVAESGRQEVRTMLIGALGCNLAWGFVDAIMYLLNTLGQRGRALLILRRVRAAARAKDVSDLFEEALPGSVIEVLRPEELESIRQRLAAQPEPPARAGFQKSDFVGALGVFLLVFASTIPVVIPFLLTHDAMRALRFSNAVAIVMLFVAGWGLGRFSGYRPWLTGLVMVAIGAVLVAITMALGG